MRYAGRGWNVETERRTELAIARLHEWCDFGRQSDANGLIMEG